MPWGIRLSLVEEHLRRWLPQRMKTLDCFFLIVFLNDLPCCWGGGSGLDVELAEERKSQNTDSSLNKGCGS